MNQNVSISCLPRWYSVVVCVVFLAVTGLLGAAVTNADDPAPFSAKHDSTPGADDEASYSAQAWLWVAMTEPSLVFPRDSFNAAEFQIFKRTQMQLIKIPVVLGAALRNPEVRKLKIDECHKNPIGWLAQQIKVESPNDTQIVLVSMTGSDRQQAVVLVNAVVEAYLSNVVDVGRNQKRQRLNELDRVYADAEAKLKSKRNEAKQLAEQLGVSDNKSLSLKQQIALQDTGMYQQHLTQTSIAMRKAKSDLDAQKTMLSKLSDRDVSDFEVDNFARNDPQARQLAEALAAQKVGKGFAAQKRDRRDSEVNPSQGKKNIHWDRYRTDLDMTKEAYDNLLKSMREGLLNMKRSDIEKKRLEKELEINALDEMVKEFSKEVEKKRLEAEKLSVSSIDLEMMMSEIEQLSKTLSGIADEREKLGVEIRSTPRVSLLQPAGIGQSKE